MRCNANARCGMLLIAQLSLLCTAGCGQVTVPIPTCGTVVVDRLDNVTGGPQAAQAETCFYQGFQQCSAVSLELNQRATIDTGTQSIFSVQRTSGGSCSIAEADYRYANTTTMATSTETCTGVSRQDGGLLITSCGAGRNITIPPPSPTSSIAGVVGPPVTFATYSQLAGYGFAWGPSDGACGAIPATATTYTFFGTAHSSSACPGMPM